MHTGFLVGCCEWWVVVTCLQVGIPPGVADVFERLWPWTVGLWGKGTTTINVTGLSKEAVSTPRRSEIGA